MDEYIRREDAIKCIEEQCTDGKMWGNDESEGTLIDAYYAIDDLMEIPPADVAPVVHGKWLNFYGDFSAEECNICGEIYEVSPDESPRKEFFDAFKMFYKYCPNCGAKMDGYEVKMEG